jgi:D-lactate dehydrogenase
MATPAGTVRLPATRLHDALLGFIGSDRVLVRPIDLAAYASDASFYSLTPSAVVRPSSIDEIVRLFALSHQMQVPLAFRAAGTSLSGQAITDGILVDVSRYWRKLEPLDDGRRVRVGPGVVGAFVNQALRRYQAKIGPDPASIGACMLGGILANNSSGMCCGVAENAYHTLDSLVFVLPSGTIIDTAAEDADAAFRAREPALAAGLLELKQAIAASPALRERIRAKYLTKNTTGYSLNALLDFERPVDIMRHLLIGSEGTLAFIAEAVLRTVPDCPVKYTGLLLFPTIREACAAIVPLAGAGAKVLEVMDRRALRSVEHQPGIPDVIRQLPEAAAGLLAEFQSMDEAERPALEALARSVVDGLALLEPARFTHDAAEQAALWKIRQGMFPSVGAVRERGTTVITEDVAFPVERLADALVDLRAVFGRHGYDEAIIFGHAKDGNLHFVLTQSFNDQAEVDRYARLMDDVVDLVARRYGGALKAEHGTGRNIAPFVETEWGPEAYAIMRRLKALVDPHDLLNPGVIINGNPAAHLTDLKSLPAVEDEVDKCIECGYCEPRCPSRDLTLTPRQRIIVRREMARLCATGAGAARLAALEADFPYDALDTCAVDGLCATACPVDIDTGQLTRRFRRLRHSRLAHRVALAAARNFATVERLVRLGLRAGHLVEAAAGTSGMTFLTHAARLAAPKPLPLWLAPMPRAARHGLPRTQKHPAVAVYFPSCISRTMGALAGEPSAMSLAEALVAVSERAGQPVWIPRGVEGCCCGVPFSSKGYAEAHALMANRTIGRFWQWSNGGRLPVVVDTSPCAYGLKRCRDVLTPPMQQRFDQLQIVDSVEFVATTLLPRLDVRRRARRVVLHPVCSVLNMDLAPQLEQIARACSEETFVPASAGCCGFAGDRGWLLPELTESATRQEAAEVLAAGADGYYSSSRTCEIGMTRATGQVYRSYLYLLEWATGGD